MPRPILKLALRPSAVGQIGPRLAPHEPAAAEEWWVTEIEGPFNETRWTFQCQTELRAHLAKRGFSAEEVNAFLETGRHLLSEGQVLASKG